MLGGWDPAQEPQDRNLRQQDQINEIREQQQKTRRKSKTDTPGQKILGARIECLTDHRERRSPRAPGKKWKSSGQSDAKKLEEPAREIYRATRNATREPCPALRNHTYRRGIENPWVAAELKRHADLGQMAMKKISDLQEIQTSWEPNPSRAHRRAQTDPPEKPAMRPKKQNERRPRTLPAGS
jgi:hypothetical protein